MRDSLAILGLTMSATERDILEENTWEWQELATQIKKTPQLLVVTMKKQLTSSNYLARHTASYEERYESNYIEVQTTYYFIKVIRIFFWGKLWILRPLGTDGTCHLHKLKKICRVSMTSTILGNL